jgi:hypothetical protein
MAPTGGEDAEADTTTLADGADGRRRRRGGHDDTRRRRRRAERTPRRTRRHSPKAPTGGEDAEARVWRRRGGRPTGGRLKGRADPGEQTARLRSRALFPDPLAPSARAKRGPRRSRARALLLASASLRSRRPPRLPSRRVLRARGCPTRAAYPALSPARSGPVDTRAHQRERSDRVARRGRASRAVPSPQPDARSGPVDTRAHRIDLVSPRVLC